MGTVSGKLGDTVFARRLGEQTQRAYVRRVNDATTRAQVVQRSKLGNIVSSYRAYRMLLQRAFENRPIGNTDYNVFASINLSKSAVYLDQNQTAAGACVVAPYTISRGTLPTIQVVETALGSFISDIAVPTEFVIDETTTVAMLSEAILSANADWQLNDQFTMIQAQQWIDQNTGYPMASVRLYDIVLSLSDATLVRSFLPSGILAVLDGFLGFQNPTFIGGVGAVHSRREASGQLKVSTQTILLTSTNSLYETYASLTAQEQAVATRGYNAGVYLDPYSQTRVAGGIIGGADSQTISGLSIGGVNVLTAQYLSPSVGQSVILTGANLDPANIFVLTHSGQSQQPLETFMNVTLATETSITGIIIAAGATDWKRLYNNNLVVKNWDYEEEPLDPDI